MKLILLYQSYPFLSGSLLTSIITKMTWAMFMDLLSCHLPAHHKSHSKVLH